MHIGIIILSAICGFLIGYSVCSILYSGKIDDIKNGRDK